MKKVTILCATLAVVLMAAPAMAQLVTTNDGLAVWYDVRDTAAAITAPAAPFTNGTSQQVTVGKKATVLVRDIAAGNLGGPGDGQVLYLSPRMPVDNNPTQPSGLGLHHAGFFNKKGAFISVDQHIKDIHTYITVENRGGVGEVISALGRDTNLLKYCATAPFPPTFPPGCPNPSGIGNHIDTIAVAMDAGLWDGTAATVTDNTGNQEDWTISTKAVKIPVAAGPPPVYDTTGGAVPAGIYHVATTTITAFVWDKGVSTAEGTYVGRDEVNNLLITRAVSTGVSPPENPDFGYTTVENPLGSGSWFSGSDGGIPEAHSGGSGNVIGTTSVEQDFTVVLTPKGDFNNDGFIDGGDISGFNAAVVAEAGGTIRQRERYIGDMTANGLTDGGDISRFNVTVAETVVQDCSIPANCPP